MFSGVEIVSADILSANKLLAEPIIDYSDPCRNRWGAIKLKLVQSQYGLNVTSDTIPDLKNLYVDWRDTVELIPMRLTHKIVDSMNFKDTPVDAATWLKEFSNTGLIAETFNDHPNCNFVVYERLKQTWINKKSVKRGNDVYCRMLQEKFKPLFTSKNHTAFFDTHLNSKRKRTRTTRMLYLTGTCDQAIVGDIVAAWGSFGAYWNHFITSLRDLFGKSAYIRTWQSQNNGYPHFHALVYFFDWEFPVIYRASDKSWRIHNRQKVIVNKKSGAKEPCINAIVDRWKWGGLEVKCCDNTKSALRDLLKYVLRDLEGGASDLTNTMVWYFNKKSFAVSRSFMGLFGAFEEPSNADLINAVTDIQEGTQEDRLVAIDIFPILPRELMPFCTQMSLDAPQNEAPSDTEPPDPPPEVSRFLDLFADQCAPVSSNTRDNGVVVTVYEYKDRLTDFSLLGSSVHRCDVCHNEKQSSRSILGQWVCTDCYPRC